MAMRCAKNNKAYAFTMVELIATIAIMAIILATVIPAAVNYVNTARRTANQKTLAVLNDALNRYKMQGGSLSALTATASIANVISRLQTPVVWNGLSHQFLQDSTVINAASLAGIGSGQTYRFYRYGDYSSETPTTGEPTSDYPNGYGYLIAQGFEGAGYDNGETWTILGGAPSPDDTSYPYEGTQNLHIYPSNDAIRTPDFAPQSEIWYYFAYICTSHPTTLRSFCTVKDASGNTLFSLRMFSDGTLGIRNGAGSTISTGFIINEDQRYHIWGRYKAGTGADSEMELWVSTTTTRPGSSTAVNTAGTSTAAATRLQFHDSTSGSPRSYIDNVYVSASAITIAP